MSEKHLIFWIAIFVSVWFLVSSGVATTYVIGFFLSHFKPAHRKQKEEKSDEES